MTGDILRELEDYARRSATNVLDSDDTRVRGITVSKYWTKLSAASTLLSLQYVRVEAVGNGCCYTEPDYVLPEDPSGYIGKDLLLDLPADRILRVAFLDSALAQLATRPDESVALEGPASSLATQRAGRVVREVERVARDAVSGRRNPRVHVVGVVGDFLRELQLRRFDVTATDFAKHVVGTTPHNVLVEHGDLTLERVASADVALITGMTIGNGTFDKILATARESGTELVMFAETAANFGSFLCDRGVATVVSEPYPFYLSGTGRCEVHIHRRTNGHTSSK